MSQRKRSQVEPTDEWPQFAALATWPEQRAYEQLRPVVLFGHPVAERAQETRTPERTLYRRAARFDAEGIASFFPPPKVEKHQRLPTKIREAIRDLKAEYPPFRAHEIADICAIRFDQRPSPHTVKRILAEDAPPARATRRFPPYQQIADPAEACLAIIRLHSEGWAVKSIAPYLECSRQQVYRTLRRWIAEGVAGLDDKASAPRQPATTVTLRAIAAVQGLQRNPRLGGFRIAAALRQQGIILSPRTCGRILAKNRALYGVPREAKLPQEPKPLPFAATWPHAYWCLDIRYLDHHPGPGKIYCLSVMDGYSRAILASMLSRSQDLVPVLLVLYAAMRAHGIPESLVTDSGGVFLANHIRRIYEALEIRKEEIARRQPWQNLIEASFGVQMRMADYGFATATTWEELLRVHEQWMEDYNAQLHWAHQRREEGRRSPKDVLDGATGRPIEEATLHRVFYTVRFGRILGAAGVRAVPPLAHLRRARAGRASGRPLALRPPTHPGVPGGAAGPVPRGLRAGQAPVQGGHPPPPLRDAVPLAAALALPSGRRAVAESLACASVCVAAATPGDGHAAPVVRRRSARCAVHVASHVPEPSMHARSPASGKCMPVSPRCWPSVPWEGGRGRRAGRKSCRWRSHLCCCGWRPARASFLPREVVTNARHVRRAGVAR